MTKNTIILFDLDGTLIDSTEAILESFGVAFESCGLEVPNDEQIKSLIGEPLDVMFAHLGVGDGNVDKCVQAYKMHYRTVHTAKTVLLNKAMDAVEEAYEFAHLGVVTTKTAQYSRELLEHFGIMKYFGVLIGKEDVKSPKPHPEPIQKALKALPKVAGAKFMIGDTCLDMNAANSAQIIGIGVTCGYASVKQLRLCATEITKNASEAVRLIAKKTNF